jgi:TusA-related sulfurtransferase
MIINACGLSCPQPVILTMNAMKSNPSSLQVAVDNNTAFENVKRLAESKGYTVYAEKKQDDTFLLTLSK